MIFNKSLKLVTPFQLETISSYEVRRRIRNQIRIVKRQIEENLEQSEVEHVEKITRRRSSASSPVRKTSRTEQNSSTMTSRQSSSAHKTVTREETVERRAQSPTKMLNQTKVTTTTTTSTTGVGKRVPRTPTKEPKDEKPIWTQKNILKKASENTRTMTSSTKKVTDQKTMSSRPKSVTSDKESRVTDCVTSSYGIGPTDDDGKPIFGLRALKKKNPAATVTGTIVQESYYSENGGPATGERTVTVYSNDENQVKNFDGEKRILGKSVNREDSKNMITMTKSQKMVDGKVEPISTTVSSRNATITRRGSVKEMSEKFIQKESESMKVNGSSSAYPKAGLILRTQSNRSRSTDVDGDENVEMRSKSGRTVSKKSTTERYVVDDGSDDCTESSKTTTTRTTTRSFLNSAGEKVTDVNDVLDRMRNADNGKYCVRDFKNNFLIPNCFS